MSLETKQDVLAMFPNTCICDNYGLTESNRSTSLELHDTAHLDSIGKPIDGVSFKAVDAEGNTVAAEGIESAGRMALQGPMVMAGYYGMPEESAKALSGGWLYTNDLVYRDADGFIYMLGRADDIINVGGEKVSPVEVENAASEFAEIRECACVGAEDPEGILGQVPVLFVVPERPEFHEEACTKFLTGKLERHKLPRRYILLDALPRNRMKKLDRKALKDIYAQGGERTPVNEVILNIRGRRSIREFTEQPVPRALLETVVECGSFAPSGHNMQTWRFTVVQNAETIEIVKTCIRTSAQKNGVYFYGFNNPTALVLVSNDRRNPYGVQDSSCAAQNIMLAAHSLGLGSVWLNPLMTLCDEPEVRQLLRSFAIPDTHIVWAMLALGWPAGAGRALAKKQNVIRWIDGLDV